MANVYSTEYAAAYNTVPRSKSDPNKQGNKRVEYWRYVQSGAGAVADVIYTVKVPGSARLLLPECAMSTTGAPATTTYDWGHLAYTKNDGTAVAAAGAAFMSAADPGADALIFGGMTTGGGTPDDQRPLVFTFAFDSKDEVTLTITIGTAALADADVVEGYYTYICP